MKPHAFVAVIFIAALEPTVCLSSTNSIPLVLSETTAAYQEVAQQAMLNEINDYAKRLSLPEKLPVTKLSLKQMHISPPAIAIQFGALGSVRTEQFSYGFGKRRRLCYITRLANVGKESLYDQNKHLAIATTAVNTNGAYLMATQWLAKAFIDLPRLSKSTTVSIRPWKILDLTTSKYTVEWQKNGKPIVVVTLVLSTSELTMLRVEDPEYILRPSLLPNLSQDNQHRHAATEFEQPKAEQH